MRVLRGLGRRGLIICFHGGLDLHFSRCVFMVGGRFAGRFDYRFGLPIITGGHIGFAYCDSPMFSYFGW